ncbi:sensor histidine kinase [Myroides sp. LJL116]
MPINWYRHVFLAITFGIITSLLVSCLFYSSQVESIIQLVEIKGFWRDLFYSFFLFLCIYATNLVASTLVSKCIRVREHKIKQTLNRKWRSTLFFSTGLIVSVVSYYLFRFLFLKYFYKVPIEGFSIGLENILVITLVSFFILLVVFNFYYADQLKALELKNKENEIALQQSYIESMKKQLSPHFLFNNLNVLISTIQEDPVKAEQFARAFSKIYRYVLLKIDQNDCLVKDELIFLQDYIYLLNVRYDNAIDFVITPEVKAIAQHKIVTLALQLLIENVVKHNAIPTNGKIKVVLDVKQDYIVLSNEKLPKPKAIDSQGFGLANLAKRSFLLSQKDILIEDTLDTFSVSVPVLISP